MATTQNKGKTANSGRQSSRSGSKTGTSNNSKATKSAPAKGAKPAQSKSLKNEIVGVLLIALGIVFCIGIFSGTDTPFSAVLHGGVFGMFGVMGYLAAPLIIVSGVLVIIAKKATVRLSKLMMAVLGLVSLFAIFHLFSADKFDVAAGFFAYVSQSFEVGSEQIIGGGAVGGIFAYPFHMFLGNVAALVVYFALLLCAIMVLTRLSLKHTAKHVAERMRETVKEMKIVREERKEEKREVKMRKKTELFVDDIDEISDEDDSVCLIDEEIHDTPVEDGGFRNYELQGLPANGIEDDTQIDTEDDIKSADEDDLPPWDTGERMDDGETGFSVESEYDIGLQGDVDTADEENAQPVFQEQQTLPFEVQTDYDMGAEPLDTREYAEHGFVRQNPLDHRIEHEKELDIPHFAPVEEEEEKPGMFEEEDAGHAFAGYNGIYHYPPADLLEVNTSRVGKSAMDEMRINADLLESTLASFGVKAKVTNVARGPVVTRYELTPALGVKVSKIVSLTDDIALNMAAKGIRIEAPIPGKSAIGVEIPNSKTTMVRIRDLVDSEEFRALKSPISFSLGKDLTGKNIFGDIAKMPHLLVAGATGSGKSVCINSIVISIIFHASPDDVQMIMIDPKMVELSVYNDIPHLRIPVVTDPKKAAGALNWAVVEMTARYKAFAKRGVRNIEGFNAQAEQTNDPKYPKLLVIVDELADLMMTASREVEDSICRIAQLGRASGIHLIIATQRPSVNVITGTIKANIPSRVAFAVSSPIDSRTILDMAGADRLLGQGDMLYYPAGTPKPVRIQGCFVNDDEVERVTNFIKSKSAPNYDDECVLAVENSGDREGGGKDGTLDGDYDPFITKALELALDFEGISASMMQRKLKVGYARAARILDEMEELGFVGPSEGAKPRAILADREDLARLKGESDA